MAASCTKVSLCDSVDICLIESDFDFHLVLSTKTRKKVLTKDVHIQESSHMQKMLRPGQASNLTEQLKCTFMGEVEQNKPCSKD